MKNTIKIMLKVKIAFNILFIVKLFGKMNLSRTYGNCRLYEAHQSPFLIQALSMSQNHIYTFLKVGNREMPLLGDNSSFDVEKNNI